MEFRKGLKEELEKEGIHIQTEKKILDISSTDIVRLNKQIGQMVEEDRQMLNQSPGMADRYPITK